MSTPLIDELTRELEAKEAALNAEKQAALKQFLPREQELADLRTTIRVLEQRDRQQHPKPLSEDTRHQIALANVLPTMEPTATFTATVTQAVDLLDFAGEEITIGAVYDQLVNQIKATMPNNARIKIGTILRRLEERGYLKKIAPPAGNDSATYAKIKEEQAA